MDNSYHTPRATEEIDLTRYILPLLEGRWTVFVVVVAAIVLSTFIQSPHVAETVIEIGAFQATETIIEIEGSRIEEQGNIEDPKNIIAKITSGIFKDTIKRNLDLTDREFPKLAGKNPLSTNLLIVTAQSKDAEKAMAVLNEFNKIIIEDHETQFLAGRKLIEEEIAYFAKRSEDLHIEKEKVESIITAQQGFYGQQLTNAYLSLLMVEDQLMIVNARLLELERSKEEIHPTEVIKKPTLQKSSRQLTLLLHITIATILGIFIGAFIVLSQEWWREKRRS